MTGDSISLVKSGEFIPVTKSAADDTEEATEEQKRAHSTICTRDPEENRDQSTEGAQVPIN